jgi:hypothetical protein
MPERPPASDIHYSNVRLVCHSLSHGLNATFGGHDNKIRLPVRAGPLAGTDDSVIVNDQNTK